MTQENFEWAIAATKIGLHVFPWRTIIRDGKEAKTPLTPNGHLAATTDPEQIATWFLSEFTGADVQVGVHAGASGVVVADRDRKSGKDGFESSEGWLEFPDTWQQPTPNGDGRHYVYLAPEGIHLAPSADYNGFEGVDVRAGSSWFGLYTEPPESRDAFAPAPEWLCEPAKSHVGSSFEGGLDDWLDSLPEGAGEPDERVLDAILRIPDYDFGHTEMVERVWELVRLGAEGQSGVRHALELLRDAWLRDPYDTADNRYSFDKAVDGAIRKAGALDDKIANFPKLIDLLTKAPNDVTDATVGEAKGKAHWFRLAKLALRNEFTEDEALALVWQAATTKALSREWGVEFCTDRIADLNREVEVERREVAKVEAGNTTEPEPRISRSLLTDDERAILAASPNFVHRYLDAAENRFPMMNENYHRANAWTILSLALGNCGFYPVEGKIFSLNLYQITLGDSSTGKSDSIIMRDEVLRGLFSHDPGFEFSSETSPEVLHEELLVRNGDPTFFNQDEASGFFRRLNDRMAGWGSGTADKLTEFYGGTVGPVHKRTSSKEMKRRTPCFLVLHFFATPDRFYGQLTTEQFLSGFLARFQWSIGAPAVLTEDRYLRRQPDHAEHREVPESSLELIKELDATRTALGSRRPARGGPEVWSRLADNAKQMEAILKATPYWTITEAAFARMVDALLKCVALLAFSRGTGRVEMVDVYGVIEQAEVWLAGLIEAASHVSSSQFEREARDIAMFVKAKGGPWITETRVYTHFSRYEPRDFQARLDWALRMGLITTKPADKDHGIRYGWKGGDDDSDR